MKNPNLGQRTLKAIKKVLKPSIKLLIFLFFWTYKVVKIFEQLKKWFDDTP